VIYYLPEYRVIGLNNLATFIDDPAVTEGKHPNGKVTWGPIELAPEVEQVIFIGQDNGIDYLRFGGDADIDQRPLLTPDRYAPSFVAIVDSSSESFSFGPYIFGPNSE
jgi:hypothetical protein